MYLYFYIQGEGQREEKGAHGTHFCSPLKFCWKLQGEPQHIRLVTLLQSPSKQTMGGRPGGQGVSHTPHALQKKRERAQRRREWKQMAYSYVGLSLSRRRETQKREDGY